jgi:AraC-like DNA-binding protein
MPARWHLFGWQRQQIETGATPWHNDNLTRRDQPACVLQHTRRGRMRLRHGAQWFAVPAGSTALFRHGSDSEYGLIDGEAYECHWLSFCGAGLAEHWDELIARFGPVVRFADAVTHEALALIDLAEPHRGTPLGEQSLAVMRFVLGLYDAADDARSAADRAIDAILADPTHPWSLKAVAARHGISREHLARAFQRRVGTAPWTWITARRVERATALLASTRLDVAEVARLCGYASHQVLARNLVAVTGKAPSAWRRPLTG